MSGTSSRYIRAMRKPQPAIAITRPPTVTQLPFICDDFKVEDVWIPKDGGHDIRQCVVPVGAYTTETWKSAIEYARNDGWNVPDIEVTRALCEAIPSKKDEPA